MMHKNTLDNFLPRIIAITALIALIVWMSFDFQKINSPENNPVALSQTLKDGGER